MFRKKDTDSEGSTGADGILRRSVGEGAPTELPPRNVTLELTESLLMEKPEETTKILRRLKRIGVMLSLDDFGTGFSSLTYLTRFPMDTLKIDASFVRGIGTDESAMTVINSIIELAHRMRMTTVAEGVETREQFLYMKQQGCDAIQGYLFGKPVPADEFAKLLKRGKVKLPDAETVTARSRQASPWRTSWRMGRASMNSLAMTISGACGTASMVATHSTGTGDVPRVSRCISCSTGLVSIKAIRKPPSNAGTLFSARSASAIKVPRPGPSSASTMRCGAPIFCQTAAAQIPISSPNIWLISGAVMKSPSRPSG